MKQPKQRNFKVQRRIYRFIMWTSAIGALIIIYIHQLWWICLVFLLYTWATAAFRSISGSYLNELNEKPVPPPTDKRLSRDQTTALGALMIYSRLGLYSKIVHMNIGTDVFYSLVNMKLVRLASDNYFELTADGLRVAEDIVESSKK